jgi:hypothetical protein
MEAKTHILSVSEWLELPEVAIPCVQSESGDGVVLDVVKVGFLRASPNDCQRAGVSASTVIDGGCFLPTAVINSNGKSILHRLPVGLAEWVIDCVAIARTGRKPLPSEVEFGELAGRLYAEFVLPQSNSALKRKANYESRQGGL